MKIYSSAFNDGGEIPARYACDGGDHSLPFEIYDAPEGTQAFAITFIDPDAPSGDFVHWMHWNLPASSPFNYEDAKLDGVGGYNSFGERGYKGPCPPAEHRYFLTVYALDTMLDIYDTSSKKELLNAMDGHILDKAEIVGRYKLNYEL